MVVFENLSIRTRPAIFTCKQNDKRIGKVGQSIMDFRQNIPVGPFWQLAYVVPDVEAAAQSWSDRYGAGPFFLMEGVSFPGWHYRGAPQDLSFDLATGQWGHWNIELIAQHTDHPSVYRDVIAAGQTGFHHFATMVDDLDTALAHFPDAPPVTTAHTPGGAHFAYIDTRNEIGGMLELVEDRQDIRDILAMVRAASLGWTGTEVLRAFPG